MFDYSEFRWYGIGLKIGIINLLKNGNALGTRKTLGKIFQPINSYTRFPEYHFFEQAFRSYLDENPKTSLTVLDIGSPKLFGLGLAYKNSLDIRLTDMTRMNLDEYATMWRAISNDAYGTAHFEQQDARSLSYPDEQFDLVYSMSVIEHINGDKQDSRAVWEMWRVLKPGGLLILSVPFGRRYAEQYTTGFAYTDKAIVDDKRYFFQRIYDETTLRAHVLEPLSKAEHLKLCTIYRRNNFVTSLYHKLRQAFGENINGLLGFLNPFISQVLNHHINRIDPNIYDRYTSVKSLKDISADVVLACRKPG